MDIILGDWDKSLKSMITACPQAFAKLALREMDMQVTGMLPTELKGYDLEVDSLLHGTTQDGDEIVLLVEFQSKNDTSMGERLLEYSFRIKATHGKPVLACVIFLRPDGVIREPPLVWKLRHGNQILVFNYTCIKLWEMAAEELLALNEPAILPLTVLTKGGGEHIIIERMFDDLVAHDLYDLLPVGNLLASLVLGPEDLEWLQRRYAQMTDILKDAPAYRWMTEDARKEGRQEGRQEALGEFLEQLRAKIMTLVEVHFPELVTLVRKQISDITSTDQLLDLFGRIEKSTKDDDVKRCLSSLNEEAPLSLEQKPLKG